DGLQPATELHGGVDAQVARRIRLLHFLHDVVRQAVRKHVIAAGIGGLRRLQPEALVFSAHAAARPTLLAVSRPNSPASQRPVATRRARSTPVAMPMP